MAINKLPMEENLFSMDIEEKTSHNIEIQNLSNGLKNTFLCHIIM